MLKWWIGFSSAVFLGFSAWAWGFVLMGYQAKADIDVLKIMEEKSAKERTEMKAELRVVKEINLRTEQNTEDIRTYLLNRALPISKP